MTAQKRPPILGRLTKDDCTFAVYWVMANTLCWGITGPILMAAALVPWYLYETRRIETPGAIVVLLFGAIFGAILGLFQQMVLSKRLKLEGNRWLLITLAGCMLYAITGDLRGLMIDAGSIYENPVTPENLETWWTIERYLPGVMLGITQWYFLRKHFRMSGWWVVATVIGLSLRMGKSYYRVNPIILSIPQGLIYSVLTLVALTLNAKRQMVEDENQPNHS